MSAWPTYKSQYCSTAPLVEIVQNQFLIWGSALKVSERLTSPTRLPDKRTVLKDQAHSYLHHSGLIERLNQSNASIALIQSSNETTVMQVGKSPAPPGIPFVRHADWSMPDERKIEQIFNHSGSIVVRIQERMSTTKALLISMACTKGVCGQIKCWVSQPRCRFIQLRASLFFTLWRDMAAVMSPAGVTRANPWAWVCTNALP